MDFTENELRSLSAANTERKWAAVPDGAPAQIVQRICERRARVLGFRRTSVATPTDVNKRLAAIEKTLDEERLARAEKLGRLIAAE